MMREAGLFKCIGMASNPVRYVCRLCGLRHKTKRRALRHLRKKHKNWEIEK